MRMIPSIRTRSGQKKYEYTCSVAMYAKPYKHKTLRDINLTFILDAKRFAKSCKYDLPLALLRLPIHYREYEARGFLDEFLNEVRMVCLEHQQDAVPSRYYEGLVTPRR
jgi:hypothetical protein